MKKQYAIKVDIMGKGNYEHVAWLEEHMDEKGLGYDKNPTSSVRNITVRKQRNIGSYTATMVLAPDRDNEGRTWEDRLSLFDGITITMREGTVDGVKEHILFFGWITSIQYSLNISDNISHDIVIECQSIDTFLNSPYLAFNQITDAVASVFKMDKSQWITLKQSKGDIPLLLENVVGKNFFSFISNITINPQSKAKLIEYIGYFFMTDNDILPFSAGLPNSSGGQNSSFMNAVRDILEINGSNGWLHELYLDIIPETKLQALTEIYGELATYHKPAPIPVKGLKSTTENHYIMLVARPLPFPFLKPSDSARGGTNTIGSVIGATEHMEKLMENGDIEMDSSVWDRIKGKGGFLSHEITEDLHRINPTRDESGINTTFLVSMSKDIDSNDNLAYGLPSVTDLKTYAIRGYKPVHINTKYVEVKPSTDTSAKDGKDRSNIVKNLVGLTLKLASFAGLGSDLKQGSMTIALNPSISIGDIIEIQPLRQPTKSLAYVTGVVHNINPMRETGSTSIQFIRMINEERDKGYVQILEELMRTRYYLSRTVNQREHLKSLLSDDQLNKYEGKNGAN